MGGNVQIADVQKWYALSLESGYEEWVRIQIINPSPTPLGKSLNLEFQGMRNTDTAPKFWK